ncbi:MAG: chemotaxis protein CheX [Deltaproteobacteria bacterium]|nr:chemotaxis protein CheX [Deltaproteobacteria bacterium]
MNTQDLQEALERAVQDVFETMYFMFPEPIGSQDNMAYAPESCLEARVNLKNSPHVMVLQGSDKLAHDMAAGLLGTDRPIQPDELVDVFKEAANMIAGGLVTALNLDNRIQLDVPRVKRLPSCLIPKTVTVFDIDGQWLNAGITESFAETIGE